MTQTAASRPSSPIPDMRVAGVALRGDGYPNALRTLELLSGFGLHIDDTADWLPPDTHLWRLARGPLATRLRIGTRLVISSSWQAIRMFMLRGRQAAPIYVPYPAPFFLWWMSWIPTRWRPHCIADAYISIWDSMYRDRSLNQQASLPSRFLRRFERRALRAAWLVLVDTEANASQMAADFGISRACVRAIPLAISEHTLLSIPRPNAERVGPVRVLFVGTMIPLHGIENVLGAIETLRDDERVEFRLVGDGQQAHLITEMIEQSAPRNVTWLRGWQDMETICREIAAADICLGVFGGSGKAARVLPFKVYMYLAAGRAVISQRALSTPEGVGFPPIETVGNVSDNGSELARVIIDLVLDKNRISSLGHSGREFYVRALSNAVVRMKWHEILAGRQ